MKEQIQLIWDQALSLIRQELNTPTFKTWFENTTPVAIERESFVISAPSLFAKQWLESRYAGLINASIRRVLGQNFQVVITVVAGEGELSSEQPSFPPARTKTRGLPRQERPALNPKYTFDSFVIGSSNRFAHAAALAVAEAPSVAYNPLFVYGGSGLGKTHLLHAIGHYVAEQHPHLTVKYVSTEKFLSEFINAIKDDKTVAFQSRYRNNDVLLVDDVQFLEDKARTQEEFFHTFNALHNANKQIVITSDRSPKDISTLEERLRSRFEWGLITDIQPPDLETRIAILKKNSERENFCVPDEILEFIASKIKTNIRELEGALIRVVAKASLDGSAVDISIAGTVLQDILPNDTARVITIDRILQEVARYFSMSVAELISSKRAQDIVRPRQVAMFLSRELTDASLPKIGQVFGGRDHTTVMYAVNKIKKALSEDTETYKQVQEITSRIKTSS
ncbi:chromosomal replication initiator protein [Candidatus Hakubella thermalkaliphila]|uniref:Chromosomal replication initiator protein DnaA n=1 Tax=Candidatus Hakubella thermalkaliphila TaxID=2754717 RepID=A0A6V8PE77_9ACTN|nr:chromosomal replication initiator protein DnaA [Candidatus Hakubella thermalkaliphila]GFP19835.1 chromosomal replication initiator protein [Candidatus Hakubella thermalkaliphila]GFP31002.1 chromosomal replication initiator protein [Candidatus Hakubella thermalkaliphila]GFP36866.1 chromosomal replication initiator protein [Candidatus Hakubella thermalkaliphila]